MPDGVWDLGPAARAEGLRLRPLLVKPAGQAARHASGVLGMWSFPLLRTITHTQNQQIIMSFQDDKKEINVLEKMEVEHPSSLSESEEKLLYSSGSGDEACPGSNVGELSGSTASSGDTVVAKDPSPEWKQRRKERKREKRRLARQASRREKRLQQKGAAEAPTPSTQPPSLQVTTPGTSTTRQRGLEGQGQAKKGGRGPTARDERRAGKKKPLVLPTAPASQIEARSETPQGDSSRPGKRTRSDNSTPPEREKKRKPIPRKASEEDKPGTSATRPSTASRPAQGKAKEKFQVVIRSNRPDGRVEGEEVAALRRSLVAEMKRAMLQESGLHLRFRNSGIVEPGWFLITAEDEATWTWLINSWSPQEVEDVSFTLTRGADTPWPVEIGFLIKSQEPVDIRELQQMLALQNGDYDVSGWEHRQTSGGPGGWWIIFRVSQEDAKSIEVAGWELHYELITLAVRRVRLWGNQPVAKGPGPSPKQA